MSNPSSPWADHQQSGAMMPTRRTRIDRRRKALITDETVDLFVRCEQLWPVYHAHASVSSCGCDDRCPECQEYLDASLKRDELLGIEPWMCDIEEVDTVEPPSDLDMMRAKAWRRTWQLRCALEAEVARRKG